jgi:uncharacterized membrane protein
VVIVSLAANLFVVAAVGGFFLRGGPPGPEFGPGPVPRMTPGAMIRALPSEIQDEAREVFGPHRQELRAAMRRIREARRATFEILSGDDYSAERLRVAFEELRAAEANAAQLGQGLVVEFAEALTPEERMAAAKAVRERMKSQFGGPSAWRRGEIPPGEPGAR